MPDLRSDAVSVPSESSESSEWPPKRTDKAGTVVVRGGRVRRRKGVAVELGVDGDRAHLVDDLRARAAGLARGWAVARARARVHVEVSEVDVHSGVGVELPLRAHQREASSHRTRSSCAEHNHTATEGGGAFLCTSPHAGN